MKNLHKKTASTLMTATILMGCASVADDNVTIPFKTSPRGHILVPVEVNGEHQQLYLFDTGAGLTALNSERIPDNLYSEDTVKKSTLGRAHSTKETYTVELPSFELGGLKQPNIRAIMMDLTDVENGKFEINGIVGFNFFKNYDLRINYSNNELTLSTPRTKAQCDAMDGVLFTLNSGSHIQFPVSLGSVSVPAILDTGSPMTGMNGLAAEAIMPGVLEQLKAASSGHGQKNSHGSDAFYGQLGIGEISVNDKIVGRGSPVNVIDLPVFELFKLDKGPAVLFGTNMLQNKTVEISYSCQKISIN